MSDDTERDDPDRRREDREDRKRTERYFQPVREDEE